MYNENDSSIGSKRTRNRRKQDEEFIQENYMRMNTRKKMKKDDENHNKSSNLSTSNHMVSERRDHHHISRDFSRDYESQNDLLSMIKRFAADPDYYEESPEEKEALYKVAEYKQKTQKVVFTEDVFEKEGKTNLSPIIFAKKNKQARSVRPMSQQMIAFENYLTIVAQLYYRRNIDLSDLITNFQETRESLHEKKNDTFQVEPPPPPKAKVGRKPRNKNPPPAPSETSTSEGRTTPGGGSVKGEEPAPGQMSFNLDILDNLISPLKHDYVFEKWSPKEIAIFEAGICKYGKNFNFLQFLIGTKLLGDVIKFYYFWKNTSHYKIWKYHKNLGNRNNLNTWI